MAPSEVTSTKSLLEEIALLREKLTDALDSVAALQSENQTLRSTNLQLTAELNGPNSSTQSALAHSNTT